MANVRPACGNDQPFRVVGKTGLGTVAFYQADFGTEYLKPTRLRLKGFRLNNRQRLCKVGLVLMNKDSTKSSDEERGRQTVDWPCRQQFCDKGDRAVAQ